jgi:hypothetical protein
MPTTGQWGGLQIRLDIPEINDAAAIVQSVFDIVITALDIALTVLNVIKSFVSSLLNPVRAIIQGLVTSLQNILLDFRQAGFYANGDWYLLGDTTREQLRGGYSAYQSRMLTRLTSRSDLSRPNLSPSTTVVGLFLYTGADISFVNRLTDTSQLDSVNQLISGFSRFFGISNVNQTSLPVPSSLQANFAQGATRTTSGGTPTDSIADFRASVSRVSGRTSTILRWGLSPSPSSDGTLPAPPLPPDGFLVEVSVFPQGLYVGYLSPAPAGTGGVVGVPAEGSDTTPSSYTTGLYQEADTGNPLQIFGGMDSVVLGEGVQWSESFNSDGSVKTGARPAFFLTDLTSTQVIQTNALQAPTGDDRVFNQRTFYVPHADILAQSLVGGSYSFELSQTDLPWQTGFLPDGTPDFDHAVQATTVYVRVLSCSNRVTAKDTFKWNVVQQQTPASIQINPVTSTGTPVNVADRSQPSPIVEVTFPTAEADTYLSALQTALAVMIISRSDIVLPAPALNPPPNAGLDTSSYTPTGLETLAQTLLPSILPNPQDYFSQAAQPESFGMDLRSKIGVLADQIIQQRGNPPQNVLTQIAGVLTGLTQWKWSDTTVAGAAGDASIGSTILASLAPTTSTDGGSEMTMYVAKNTESLPGYVTNPLDSHERCVNLGVLGTYPQAGFGSGIPEMVNASEAAPIVVSLGSGTTTSESTIASDAGWYARDLLTPEVYAAAQQVLGMSVGDSTLGGWLAIRPFQSVGTVSSMTGLATQIADFAGAIGAGVQGGADLILNFISMLEQRVREIQEVIRSIEVYLEIPLSIEIPDAVGLVLVGDGMDGIVSGLMSATNKPTDGPNAYAGGLVVLGGGVPAIITDLISLLVASA